MQLNYIKQAGRILLAFFLLSAGIGHITWARTEFLAQVPKWLPIDGDSVVVFSGIIELALGLALLISKARRQQIGWAIAIYFLLIFPGNIAQYVNGTDAFGLNNDTSRLIRLFFQPVFILWALWCTGVFPKNKPEL
ncbi:MAG TPA: hypothetical protein VIK80_15750 [Flavihumibacter sp.]|jgi:uncharacterized membrane protein